MSSIDCFQFRYQLCDRRPAIAIEHAGVVVIEQGFSMPEKPVPLPRLITIMFFDVVTSRIGIP